MAETEYRSSEDDRYLLALKGLRGGSVAEISAFLEDVERSYNSLYAFNFLADVLRYRYRYSRYYDDERFLRSKEYARDFFRYEFQMPYLLYGFDVSIRPEYRLRLNRVEILSPGFWEFIGGLNPLQQLREYLKDRHERRKDRDYREAAEKERMQLENELLQKQLMEKDTSILKNQLDVMRQCGVSEVELRQLVWSRVGAPLAELGRHQDTGLIAGPIELDKDGVREV